MTPEIARLEQGWEEWRWAKRKDMIRQEEFPEAERLLTNRSTRRQHIVRDRTVTSENY